MIDVGKVGAATSISIYSGDIASLSTSLHSNMGSHQQAFFSQLLGQSPFPLELDPLPQFHRDTGDMKFTTCEESSNDTGVRNLAISLLIR